MSDINITVKKSLADRLILEHLFATRVHWVKFGEDWYNISIIIENDKKYTKFCDNIGVIP